MFVAETGVTPAELFAVVSDLTTFPRWIDLVHKVEAHPPTGEGDGTEAAVTGRSTAAAGEPAWLVTLRAEIGPFTRSKRLRMVRTVHRPPSGGNGGLVRFDRAELDGRDHAGWTMEIGVEPAEGPNDIASRANCRLHYDGALWNRLLEGRLDDTAERATAGLQAITARPVASGGDQ